MIGNQNPSYNGPFLGLGPCFVYLTAPEKRNFIAKKGIREHCNNHFTGDNSMVLQVLKQSRMDFTVVDALNPESYRAKMAQDKIAHDNKLYNPDFIQEQNDVRYALFHQSLSLST